MKLTHEEIAALTRPDAQRLVQQKMTEIRALLDDCEALMDHHRFVIDLPTQPMWTQLTYLPKNLTDVERGSIYANIAGNDGNLSWCGIQNHHEGGEWVSSSEFGDC